jgi:hypothetical protein
MYKSTHFQVPFLPFHSVLETHCKVFSLFQTKKKMYTMFLNDASWSLLHRKSKEKDRGMGSFGTAASIKTLLSSNNQTFPGARTKYASGSAGVFTATCGSMGCPQSNSPSVTSLFTVAITTGAAGSLLQQQTNSLAARRMYDGAIVVLGANSGGNLLMSRLEVATDTYQYLRMRQTDTPSTFQMVYAQNSSNLQDASRDNLFSFVGTNGTGLTFKTDGAKVNQISLGVTPGQFSFQFDTNNQITCVSSGSYRVYHDSNYNDAVLPVSTYTADPNNIFVGIVTPNAYLPLVLNGTFLPQTCCTTGYNDTASNQLCSDQGLGTNSASAASCKAVLTNTTNGICTADPSSTGCTKYCTDNIGVCDTLLNSWCTLDRLGTNSFLCGCHMNDAFYADFFTRLAAAAPAASGYSFPNCFFPSCASGLKSNKYTTTCPNITQCISTTNISNQGVISGGVAVSQSAACGNLTPAGTGTGTSSTGANGDGGGDDTSGVLGTSTTLFGINIVYVVGGVVICIVLVLVLILSLKSGDKKTQTHPKNKKNKK